MLVEKPLQFDCGLADEGFSDFEQIRVHSNLKPLQVCLKDNSSSTSWIQEKQYEAGLV